MESYLVTVRPLVIFLAWVLSCENDNSPPPKEPALATTPSLAKRCGAATRVGVGSFIRKQQEPTAQRTCRGHQRAKERRRNAGSRWIRDVI